MVRTSQSDGQDRRRWSGAFPTRCVDLQAMRATTRAEASGSRDKATIREVSQFYGKNPCAANCLISARSVAETCTVLLTAGASAVCVRRRLQSGRWR